MKIIADELPAEIAQQLHPDRRKNESGYWAIRDQLLDQYKGLWIGFADGSVIASGSSPVAVFHESEASGRHPFLICVGKGRSGVPYSPRRVPVRHELRWRSIAVDKCRVQDGQRIAGNRAGERYSRYGSRCKRFALE